MLALDLTPAQVVGLIKFKIRLVSYDEPGARLMLAIWGQALADAYRTWPGDEYVAIRKRTTEAREYIRSRPACLELAGVNPEYAERIIRAKEARLPIEQRIFQ